MSLLTVLLLLLLLILLFDHHSQNKEGYTSANDLRTTQYKINGDQLKSTKSAIEQNKQMNSETDAATLKLNKVLNNRICSKATFNDYGNIDETNRSYDKGLIIKPNAIPGMPKLGTQFDIIKNDDIYSKCQPNQNIDLSINCQNLSQRNDNFANCFDVNGNSITLDKGETIKDENGNEMCKYRECANQCSVQSRYCYTSNNADGFVREKIFMDKCIHPIENNCVLLNAESEYFENKIIDLCPYKTYYHISNSSGKNDGRELHFYDKSVELMGDGTTYRCIYDHKDGHKPTDTFDSLDELLGRCGISNFQSNLQCYSHVENQKYIYNTEYPYDQIGCRYHPNEPCYFKTTDKNNSNILCEYNSYNGETKECVLPISCTKPGYTPHSESHVGNVKSETYDQHTIHGQLQEEIIDGKKYLSCVYDNSPTVAASAETFISEPQYLDKITCSNLRCGQGVMKNLPNGQVQCVFHNCPSDGLIHTNNILSKSTNRLTRLQASQKLANNKINEFQNVQKSIEKDSAYIKNQQYLLNNQEEQLTDKAIRNSSKLDAFKSIDTTLRRKINNTNEHIHKLKKQLLVEEETPIIEGFSMDNNLETSLALAEAAIEKREEEENLERQAQENIENIRKISNLNAQTRTDSQNETIENDRIQQKKENKLLNEKIRQLKDLGISYDKQKNIENTSIDQYKKKDYIMKKKTQLENELSTLEDEYKTIIDAEKEKKEDRNIDPKYNRLKLSNMLTAVNDENNALKKDFISITECNKKLNPSDFLKCILEDLKKTNTRITEVEEEKKVAVQAKIKAETAAVKARAEADKANAEADKARSEAINAKTEANKVKLAAETAAAKAIADKIAANKTAAAKIAAAKAAAAKVVADKAVVDKTTADKAVANKAAKKQRLAELAAEEQRLAELAAAEKHRLDMMNASSKLLKVPVKWDRSVEIPYILNGYPIINRSSDRKSATVTLGYSRIVKIHWVNLPTTYNKPVEIIDIAINPMLIKENTDWGVGLFTQEKTQTITVKNLSTSQSYHLYMVLYSTDSKKWSKIYKFKI